MTDIDLLEYAAKADGRKTERIAGKLWIEKCTIEWNPLTDDGDALRLAVKLELVVRPQEKCVYVETNPDSLLGFSAISSLEMHGDDPYAATRRAITRAAAEIGRTMP